VSNREQAPWWLWPNLLSLDAPIVAIAWFWMFSKAWGVVSLPAQLVITLALTVWAIYALDRILDSRQSYPRASLERRHCFHQRYRWVFILAIVSAIIWIFYAALTSLSQTVLMYGLFVMGLVAVYFLLAFFLDRKDSSGFLKNAIAGMTFAYGTAAGVHAYSPILQFTEMLFSWEVVLFGALCGINMTAIDFWELEGEEEEDASALIATATVLLAGVAMFFATRMDAWSRPFHYALLVGAAGIYLLNRMRFQLDKEARRLWVDLALLAPVLMYWVWVTYYETAVA